MPNTPQLVEDLTSPPIVGREYLVPCVWINCMWWPVVGPAHTDPDLGVPENHLHYDTRFLLPVQLWWNSELSRKLACQQVARQRGAAVVFAATNDDASLLLVHPVDKAGPPELRVRVCQREVLTFPITGFLAKLEHEFRAATIKRDCRVCPHRGTSLASLAPNAAGGVVCTGHGLQWHHETGRLMPRLPPSPTPTKPAEAANAVCSPAAPRRR